MATQVKPAHTSLPHAHIPTAARRITEAATRFVDSLTPDQRARTCLPFKGDERYEWSYVPVGRNGLTLVEMTGPQVDLALAMLDSALSARGAHQTREVMKLEATLWEWEHIQRWVTPWNREVERYYLTIHGNPGSGEPWGFRVGGHHIGTHVTVVAGEHVSVMPHFFGANPAEVRHGPDRGKRVLAAEEDLARQLLASLDGPGKQKAITSKEAPRDILTRMDRVAKRDLAPRGLAIKDMSDPQRVKLVTLIKNYTERAADDISPRLWKRIEGAGLDAVTFAWAGTEERGKGHYYAIQGPTFLIEYDNTQNDANHIHSVIRDFDHDWGEDLMAAHYRESHR
jgi:Protein of unknown function (DUF3500)